MALDSKLQRKPGQPVRLVNPPPGFSLEGATAADTGAEAILAFARDRSALDALGETVLEPARRDQLVWLAYPKAGQLGTDLNRDVLRGVLAERGVQPVRQVSLDETWSALRLRPA